ncbi:unnamed protein product [Meloidogyne enterolobii]|uniref:Uncharacterized protein n=1 Tax=Meloidogyne enterolobii TaxID=390850 RepID=A0ACB0ZT25_MELEN
MIGNNNGGLEKLKENWRNYCYIDKENIEFERPEEWAVNYKNEIGLQNDGFRLAYLGEDNDELMSAINDKESGLTTKQKEEIFKEISNNFYLHKVTFLEAHKMFNLFKFTTKTTSETQNELAVQQTNSEIQLEYLQQPTETSSQKQKETYYGIKFEMKKIKAIFENQGENKKVNENEEDGDEKALNALNRQLTDLKSVNSKYFQQFEGNIKLKTDWQKCLNFVILLKIVVKNHLKMKKKIFEKFEKECKLNKLNVEKENKKIKKLYELVVKEKNEEKNPEKLKNNLNKLFKELKKIIGQIDNKNKLMEYFEELKSIEKKSEDKGRRVEIIEKMNSLVAGKHIEEFDERLENKYKFLLENWKKLFFGEEKEKNIFYKQILPEIKGIENYFIDSGDLFVGYCLTKRIENSFNKDGTVKFSEFLSNGVGQEYGLELNEVLGQKRIDIG